MFPPQTFSKAAGKDKKVPNENMQAHRRVSGFSIDTSLKVSRIAFEKN